MKVCRGMTSERWAIATKGGCLEPNKNGQLFVTTSRGLAEVYARAWAELESTQNWIVVSFDLDEAELEPDFFWFHFGGRALL